MKRSDNSVKNSMDRPRGWPAQPEVSRPPTALPSAAVMRLFREESGEQVVLPGRLDHRGRAQQLAQMQLPFLHVEMVLVLQRPTQDRRELVKCLQQLSGRLPQRLGLEAIVARAHVLEDALFGARRHDRVGAALDEDVGALAGPATLLDRHQPEDPVGTPILPIAQKDHAVALDVHGASTRAVSRQRSALTHTLMADARWLMAISSAAAPECRPTPLDRSSRPSEPARRNSPST